ncbi:MAG: hypothetical protein IIX45_02375 [Lachnospiraceae bacterium]|nr:hypothetical protein [Lachnospiraceae bacterium]
MMKSKDKNGKNKMPKRSLTSRFDIVNRFKHWYMGGISLTRNVFRVKAAKQTILIIVAILTVFFMIAAIYTESGEFVINIDSGMADDGFYLSETTDFSERLITLNGDAVIGANNISIFDIPANVNQVNGQHNGKNYVAYTFYITYLGKGERDYHYSLEIRNSAKGAEKAMWIMMFKNDEQITYAMEGAGGEPETQYAVSDFPFEEVCEIPNEQYQTEDIDALGDKKEDYVSIFDADGVVNKLVTVPFESDRIVCSGDRLSIKTNEYDKYTIVIWYEGEDPECVDDILGGWVELFMKFNY